MNYASHLQLLGVGKTCLATKYCNGIYPDNASPTIGASFQQRRLLVGNVEVTLQIWDTAGIPMIIDDCELLILQTSSHRSRAISKYGPDVLPRCTSCATGTVKLYFVIAL